MLNLLLLATIASANDLTPKRYANPVPPNEIICFLSSNKQFVCLVEKIDKPPKTKYIGNK